MHVRVCAIHRRHADERHTEVATNEVVPNGIRKVEGLLGAPKRRKAGTSTRLEQSISNSILCARFKAVAKCTRGMVRIVGHEWLPTEAVR